MTSMEVGSPEKLGAHVQGDGVNVAVWSHHAERIELCLFDAAGKKEIARLHLPGRTGDVFHGFVPKAQPGMVYGLRAHGPYAPDDGHRFNPNKLLIDPYARELVGRFQWHDAVLGYQADHPEGCHSFDHRDSAPFVPKCRVSGPIGRANRLPSPARPWGETVLYEMHVRGYSEQHPGIAREHRGTIAGLAQPASIAHLKRLGITAVELLPVAAWLDELHLMQRGLTNYWGYNPIAFFAMQPSLAGPGGLSAMVDAIERLHGAGIEVILDVVFNHTGEGDERGPTLSLRGLDNASYYLADSHRPGGYRNLSGCGNTLAAHRTEVGRLITDALRFWADEVGVDGFRFDLASAIARNADGHLDRDLPWLAEVHRDPVLSRRKLIAEAWDCEGHFVGGFAPGWSEWNDRFRDDQRRFWRGDPDRTGALATRLAGSSDLFGHSGRNPSASINFITAHDGMTLADLVSYRHRQNLANGEHNRDGTHNDHSDDCGVQGPTTDASVLKHRSRRARAMIAALMLSRGVPMLRAGDEFGATQLGNNNAYCHDSPLTWLHWPDRSGSDSSLGALEATVLQPPTDASSEPTTSLLADDDLRPLIATLARLRAALPCLRAERFFDGRPSDDAQAVPDLLWLRPDGLPMASSDWHSPDQHALAMLLDAGKPEPGAQHDRVWIAMSPGFGPTRFQLPELVDGSGWVCMLDTARDTAHESAQASASDSAELRVPQSGMITIDGPAVVLCASGSIASAELRRWRIGLPKVSFIAADETEQAIEFVLDESGDTQASELELVIDNSPAIGAEPIRLKFDQTEAIEARTVDGRKHVRHRVVLPGALTLGHGSIRLDRAGGTASTISPASAITPVSAISQAVLYRTAPRCWLPPVMTREAGAWALSVQLYGLQSKQSWGIGDFDDLARLGEMSAGIGASGILVSPLHAPSMGWPDRGSPYSPSSRLALNPLFVSLPKAAERFDTPRFDAWLLDRNTRTALATVRSARLIDYPAVLALKRQGFEHLWLDFNEPKADQSEFARWRQANDHRLRSHLLFEAIAEHAGVANWREWPAALATIDSAEVREFEIANAPRLAFHAFIQWLADSQWREAGERARRLGASIGPIADLAVGTDAVGADAWAQQDLIDGGFEIGAPPDPICPEGQAWGLPPWRPDALADKAHGPIAALLQATMGGAGGLRIDHVMALERQFWVPRSGRSADGAYVAYPLEELLQVVATHSVENRCLVIGEDLGTVRHGLRERLACAAVLSYKVAWFERDAEGRLTDSRRLPPLAAVCASTHDLPTIDGWVAGLDIDERVGNGSIDLHAGERERSHRAWDVAQLQSGLTRQGIRGDDLVDRLHRWLAVSSCRLAIVQMEDVAGLARQPNLPGTPDKAPNWRQSLPIMLESLADAPRWRALPQIFRKRHHQG
jgi:glycogen operon protein